MAAKTALDLLRKVKTKEIDFNDGKVEVKELTFDQVKAFSELAQSMQDVESFENNRQQLGSVIRVGVVGMEELTDEDIGAATLLSLRYLSEQVLEFNGLKVTDEKEGNDSAQKS